MARCVESEAPPLPQTKSLWPEVRALGNHRGGAGQRRFERREGARGGDGIFNGLLQQRHAGSLTLPAQSKSQIPGRAVDSGFASCAR